ncbi:MAG: hypothetical protein NC321_12320 [Clostridium sp.]|nr:hypothetical protein [Clostridium sp.]
MRKFNRFSKRVAALALAGIMSLIPVNHVQAANAGNAIAKGIDVSKHNGAVNWGSVASSGISFAFIKAGSTKSGMDPYFDANMRGAQNAGLKVGVYVYSYATTVEQAKNEADMVVGWLENYTVSFPVVFDIEDSCHKGLSQGQIQSLVNTFCSTVAAAGYYPMVYSSKNWFNQRIGNVGYDKWVAQYADNLEYNGASFWQSSSHGSVSGVSTRVDIDYQFKDFSSLIISDGFLDRNGQTLFFAGYKMQRGWVNYNDTRYYLDGSGFLQRNCWFADESGTYYLMADGSVARGQAEVEGQNYYFDGNGVRLTGWVNLENGRFYYAPESGVMQHGWFSDGSGTYYLTANGDVARGQVEVEGQNYYFDGNGVRLTGWVNLENGRFYYAPDSGAMQHGWFADESGTYYLAANGDVTRGRAAIDGQEYNFDGNGVRLTGWADFENGRFYYAPDTGAMQHGWLDDVSGRYYFSTKDGHMLVGDVDIEGKKYYFAENGVMQTGIVTKADGKQYYYDETGALIVNNQQLNLNGTLYQADAQGVLTLAPVPEPVPEQADAQTQAAPAPAPAQ